MVAYQKIAKIAVKIRTDWEKDAAKWDALDPLMGNCQDSVNPDWIAEKNRIADLGFWAELSMGGEKVWHVNAASAVFNFYNRRFSWARTVFGETVASVESKGSYTIYNRGSTHNYEIVRDVNICEYSLAKMMDEGERKNIFAAGKFQIIPLTLKSAVDRLKLDTSLPFDEEMQDYIFDEFLIKIARPQIIAYLEGNGDVEDAIYAWAKEFASGGIRKGKKLSKRKKMLDGVLQRDENDEIIWHEPLAETEGVSYYSGDGINKAHLSPDAMRSALEEAKKSR